MTTVFFIPGILGSKLSLAGEEIWPPTPLEVLTGYKRIDELTDAAVVSSGVIEKQCVPVYGPILDALRGAGFKGGGANDVLIPWHYDWRRDLTTLSLKLAGDINSHPGDVVVVCHSMGGLIARAALERVEHVDAAWQKRIKLVVFLATPHNGAPLAVARAMGTGGSSLGLSGAQLRQLCGADGFPADYQLFPRASEPVIWRSDALDPLAPQSLNAPGLGARLGLNAASLKAAFDFQALLDPSRRPAYRRYFSIVSAAHETITRFDGKGATLAPVFVKNSGDGTVPIQSAAALDDQTAFVVADHVGVAKADAAIQIVLMLLGKETQVPVVAGAALVDKPTLSLSQSFTEADQPYEILVALPASESRVQGEIVIERLDLDGNVIAAPPITVAVNAEAEGLSQLSMRGPRLAPGQYRFVLQTNGAEASRGLVVSPPLESNPK